MTIIIIIIIIILLWNVTLLLHYTGRLLLKRIYDVILTWPRPWPSPARSTIWLRGIGEKSYITRVRATVRAVPDNVQRPLSLEATKASARFFWQAPAPPSQATVVCSGHPFSGWCGAVYWDSRLHFHHWTTR